MNSRVSGPRLLVGIFLMGIAVPVTLFLLLKMQTPAQFFSISATTFCSWGVADVLSSILERPRLKDRTPGHALREDIERRKND